MAALADVGREMTATLELNVLLERDGGAGALLLGGTSSAIFLPEAGRHDLPRDRRPSGDIADAAHCDDRDAWAMGIIGIDRRRGQAGDRQRRRRRRACRPHRRARRSRRSTSA